MTGAAQLPVSIPVWNVLLVCVAQMILGFPSRKG